MEKKAIRRVILEFVGGPWDGMNLHNESSDRLEAQLAAYCYLTTEKGTRGRTVLLPSSYAIRRSHSTADQYEVAERTERDEEVLVRFRHCNGRGACELPSLAASVRIVVRFHGGFLDGKSLDSLAPDHNEALLAIACYHVTEGGKLGARLDGHPAAWRCLRAFAPSTFLAAEKRQANYAVIDRRQSAVTIRLTFACME